MTPSAGVFARIVAGVVTAIAAAIGFSAVAQTESESLPIKPTRFIEFTTTEGTQMSVDVSPDGGTIVFDLLGDLYSVPMSGGRATRLTNGMAWDQHPRYSPDGKFIAFVSDRSGTENLWIVDPKGGNRRAITHERDIYALLQPLWTADGQSLLVHRADGPWTHSLWQYEVTSGAGKALSKASYESGGMPISDGKRIAFITSKGVTTRLLNDASDAGVLVAPCQPQTCFSPLVSPDGRWLVYARKSVSSAFEAVVYLKSIDTNVAAALGDAASAESALVGRVQIGELGGKKFLPGYAFTADSKSLIFSSLGRLQRIELANRIVTWIPFEAQVRAELGPLARFPVPMTDGVVDIKQSRALSVAPNGKAIVVSALGKIWRKEDEGAPRRLTNNLHREGEPAYSPDGRWIAFVTSTDAEGGRLWKMQADGGTPIPLTNTGGAYIAPRWLPDGSGLVCLYSSTPSVETPEGPSGLHQEPMYYPLWVDANGGGSRKLIEVNAMVNPISSMRGVPIPNQPSLTVSADGRCVYFLHRDEKKSVELISVSLSDGSHTIEMKFKYPKMGFRSSMDGNFQALVSPDQRWLALRDGFRLAVVPFVRRAAGADVPTLDIFDKGSAIFATDAALSPTWSHDGKSLQWLWDGAVYDIDVQQLSRRESRPVKRLDIGLRMPQRAGQGSVLLKGARLVTLSKRGQQANAGSGNDASAGVIERGDLLIVGRRIAAAGPSGSLRVPPKTHTLDVSGMTIVPGLMNLLGNHTATPGHYLVPERTLPYDAALAYGMTTNYTSVAEIENSVTAEMLALGELRGPREVLSFIWESSDLNWIDKTDRAVIDRSMQIFKNFGHEYFKSREDFGHRYQRQWLNQAAVRVKLSTSFHQHDMSRVLQHVLDGYGMIIHGLGATPIYRDVIELLARSGTVYNMGPSDRDGLGYKVAASAPNQLHWRDRDKTRTEGPRVTQDGIERANGITEVSRDALQVLRAGGLVVTGDDGRSVPGLSMHESYWSLAFAGWTPADILRIATAHGAEALGFGADLGTIEPGKIADLVILSKNPLEDIFNTAHTRYVIKDGVVYDAATLKTIN